ncbi:MAG: tRNA (adenosine(37)-N6)-threonylcarbamoyltransferase complex transferase subunit TsaD [Patescibacteria group bacterium]
MKILSIETSCDETAISLIDGNTRNGIVFFKVLGNALLSQVKLHAKYGGVFPMMAKREHSKALTHLLTEVLGQGKMLEKKKYEISKKEEKIIKKILAREPELLEKFLKTIPALKKPHIDRMAVTYGPGLEPALWVGINFALALSYIWKIPIVPINHMEGHIFSALLKIADKRGLNADLRRKNSLNAKRYALHPIHFPVLALLISGGHTELVLSKKFGNYKVIGSTRDDAVGEAFDKVARMLELPYPGGPEISRLAKKGKKNLLVKLPRPMINSGSFDFSFSGLKTAVLYLIKKIGKLTAQKKADIAKEFENAITEVLTHKTTGALKKYEVKTLLIGGGVSANEKIRETFAQEIKNNFPNTKLFLPSRELTTDNALMIGITAYFKKLPKTKLPPAIQADGNLLF